MLHTMERTIGKYRITTSAYVLDWSWELLPRLSVAFDEVGFYASIGFLCFSAAIDIDNEIKEQEWNEKINSRFRALTDTEEGGQEEEGQPFSLN